MLSPSLLAISADAYEASVLAASSIASFAVDVLPDRKIQV
jgi:hypothetical protein